MFKYIVLCVCVSWCGVLCDLNKEEGADCDWKGIKGTCVKETRCMTTLDVRSEEKPPVCSKQGEDTIICCTDCKLVNDTRNVVMNPRTGLLWKDGTKARDNCLQYLDDLHFYNCRRGGFYSGIRRELNDKKKCHDYSIWGIGGSPPPGDMPGAKYPHQALLGFGEDLETAKWVAGGAIISDKYILTAAHPDGSVNQGRVKFVALGVKSRTEPSSWQTHKVKRFIKHPDFELLNKHHDIALIETETPITFGKNVLPACLHVEEAADTDKAVATTWLDLKSELPRQIVDTIQEINLEKVSDEECKSAYSSLVKVNLDFTTQMCYGSKTNPTEACRGLSGEPLLVETQLSTCIYTVIGVTSFGPRSCGPDSIIPDVYTKVLPHVPWIESIVWP